LVTATVILFRVFVWSLACEAEHIYESICLGVLIHRWIGWYTQKSKLGSLQVHRLAYKVLMVGFEDELTLLPGEKFLTFLEEYA
jgi:hypothetical protein